MRYYLSETIRIVYVSKRLATGLTPKITIWNPTPAIAVNQANMTELAQGIYYYDYTATVTGTFIYKLDGDSIEINNFIVSDSIDRILKINKNKWRILSNQLIIYDNDGTTALYTFDLKDNNGNATEINVYRRDPV